MGATNHPLRSDNNVFVPRHQREQWQFVFCRCRVRRLLWVDSEPRRIVGGPVWAPKYLVRMRPVGDNTTNKVDKKYKLIQALPTLES